MKNIFKMLFVIISVVILTGCGNKKIDWSEIELGEKIPKPEVLVGNIEINRKDLADIKIKKISKKQYKDYVQNCINSGFNIDLEDENWDMVYGAFDKEGYSIRILYTEGKKEMDITFEIPESASMKEIEWPTMGLGAMLPKPKSNFGDISWDNSETFIVHLGKTTIDDFKEYIKSCENFGYTKDYHKDDKYYNAKNAKNYELTLRYLGANVIEIALDAPEDESEDSNTETQIPEPTNPGNSEPNNTSELRQDFKKAMDDYENFIDEYISFMKKYKESNGSDLSLLSEYTNFLTKYSEFNNSFAEWKNKNLNAKELAYYLEVQTRINKKLLEIAN